MRLSGLFVTTVVIFTRSSLSERVYSSIAPLRLQSNGTQCRDSDRQTWQQSSANNRQFFSNVETCGNQAAGATDITANVTSCLTQVYPDMSESCGQCYASDVDCGATNCRVPCQGDSSSSACQSCLNPCTAALSSCTGSDNLPRRDTSNAASGSVHLLAGFSSILVVAVSLSQFV